MKISGNFKIIYQRKKCLQGELCFSSGEKIKMVLIDVRLNGFIT